MKLDILASALSDATGLTGPALLVLAGIAAVGVLVVAYLYKKKRGRR